MDYIKSTIPHNNFNIHDFFKYINAEDKEEADDTFKELVRNISLLENTKKNEHLRVFAKRMKKYKFRVLESTKAYKYWTAVALKRIAIKKLYLKYIAEEKATMLLTKTLVKFSEEELE